MTNETRRACRLAAALCQLSMFMPSPAGVTILAPATGPTRAKTSQAHVNPRPKVDATAAPPKLSATVAYAPRTALPAIAAVNLATVAIAAPTSPASASSMPVAPVESPARNDVATGAQGPTVDTPLVIGPAVYLDHNDQRERSPGVDVEWAVYLGSDALAGAQAGVTPTILRAENAAHAVLIVSIWREGKGGPRYAIPVEYAYQVKDVLPVVRGKAMKDDAVDDDGESEAANDSDGDEAEAA